MERSESDLAKKPYYLQNGGELDYEPPDYLSKVAAQVWRKLVPFLKNTEKVKRIDSSLLEMYCVQYEIYRESYKQVNKYGVQIVNKYPIQTSKGEVVGEETKLQKNPALIPLKDAITQMSVIGAQLGLSPKARQELLEIVDDDRGNEPNMSDLLGNDGDYGF